MSHFSSIQTKIRDGEVLERCLRESGYRVERNAEIKGYDGTRRVDFAVRMSEGYDIGFARADDGHYQIVGDWWGVRGTSREEFTRRVGHGVESIELRIQREAEELERKMRREYALEKTLEQLKTQGFQVVKQETESDGTVRLVARRWQ